MNRKYNGIMKKLSNVGLIDQQKENFQNVFQQFTQELTDLQQTLHEYYLSALEILSSGNYIFNTSIVKELKMYLWQMQKIANLSGNGQKLFLLEINSTKPDHLALQEMSIDKVIELNRESAEIHISKSLITEVAMTKIKNKCGLINSLSITSQTVTVDHMLADRDIPLLGQLSKISKLSIRGSRVTDKGICDIMERFGQLKEIDVSECSMLSNDGLKALSGYRFVSIKAKGCEGISERGILSLIATSYNLNYLQVSNISTLNYPNLIDHVSHIYNHNTNNFKWLQLSTNIGTILFINKLSYLTHFTISDFITDREVEILLGEQPEIDGLFFNSCEELHSDTVKFIIAKCRRLRRLSFKRFINLTDALLGDVVSHLTALEYLDLSQCYELTDKSIYQMTNQLRKLINLNLTKCQNITDESLSYLISKMPTLSALNISYCKNITDSTIFQIGNYLPQLKALNIERCDQMTNAGIAFLSEKLNELQGLVINFCEQINDESMMLVAVRLRKLVRLEMEWCQISQKCLSLIAENMHELAILNLNYCSSVFDDAIIKLGRHSPKLHTVKLQSCDKLSSKAFSYMFDSLKSLRYLDLKECSGVNDQVIQKLSSNCRGEMMHFDLSWCSSLTDKGILGICQFQHQLLYLNLNGCNLIGDSGIKWICSGLNALEYLNLSLCENLTDKSITGIANSLSTLRIFYICDIKNITDNSVSALSNLPNLQELHLSGCIQLTSTSLIALLHNLEKLHCLNISECSNIFTESLLLLVQRMKNLKKFCLASLQIEDNLLEMVGEYMTHLRSINLEYCRKITDNGVRKLMEKIPGLVRIDLQNTSISEYTKQCIFQELSFRQSHFLGTYSSI